MFQEDYSRGKEKNLSHKIVYHRRKNQILATMEGSSWSSQLLYQPKPMWGLCVRVTNLLLQSMIWCGIFSVHLITTSLQLPLEFWYCTLLSVPGASRIQLPHIMQTLKVLTNKSLQINHLAMQGNMETIRKLQENIRHRIRDKEDLLRHLLYIFWSLCYVTILSHWVFSTSRNGASAASLERLLHNLTDLAAWKLFLIARLSLLFLTLFLNSGVSFLYEPL